MRATTIHYPALLQLPEAEQGKALAQAISFELQKPQLVQDILAGKAALHTGHVKALHAGPRPDAPSMAQITSHLARKWVVPGDTPLLESIGQQVQDWYHTGMPDVDTGYEQLFGYIDMRDSSQDHFSINATSGGITWKQLKPGEEVKIRRTITEDETIVRYLEMGAGFGVLMDWLRFQQWWRIDDVIAEFRATYYDTRAKMHYGLFTALGSGINTAFATDDATTFNNAVGTILRNVEGVGGNPGVYIVANPETAGRIQRMLMATVGSHIVAAGGMSQPLAFTVRGVIVTQHIASNAGHYYVVLPGRKLKRADWQDLAIKSDHNIYSEATDWVGRGKYNAIVGDQAQVRRVALS